MADGVKVKPDPKSDMKPGDQAPPGTPGAGEAICRHCSGTGKIENGEPCPDCAGTGRVVEVVGGA